MDRQEWLAERQAVVVAVYDAEAPAYDEHEYPLGRPAGTGGPCAGPDRAGRDRARRAVRDGQVLSAGRRGWPPGGGADQSAGMLAQARARDIASRLDQIALQDLSYAREFDAVITVDAMENAPPGACRSVEDHL